MKVITCMALALFALNVTAQDFQALAQTEFANQEAYRQSEPQVLQAADLLLGTPLKQDELNRQFAFLYLFKWMEGTPDHTFSLDQEVMDLTKGNDAYLTLFLAGMVKTALEHKGGTPNAAQGFEQAADLLTAYCANPANGLKPNKALKRRMKAAE